MARRRQIYAEAECNANLFAIAEAQQYKWRVVKYKRLFGNSTPGCQVPEIRRAGYSPAKSCQARSWNTSGIEGGLAALRIPGRNSERTENTGAGPSPPSGSKVPACGAPSARLAIDNMPPSGVGADDDGRLVGAGLLFRLVERLEEGIPRALVRDAGRRPVPGEDADVSVEQHQLLHD